MKTKMGRPSIKTPELLEDILNRIMQGISLRKICEQEGMPDLTTVCKWLRDDEDFINQYARAREVQADLMAEEIVTLSDKATDKNNADAIRVRILARQWAASKLKPKKYGDKLDVTTQGDKIEGVVVEIIKPKE